MEMDWLVILISPCVNLCILYSCYFTPEIPGVLSVNSQVTFTKYFTRIIIISLYSVLEGGLPGWMLDLPLLKDLGGFKPQYLHIPET